MNWYPWLNHAYRQLVESHQQGRGHHAILLHAHEGTGAGALLYGLSRWLMCQDKQGMKSCGKCHGCHLMLAETHSDWHVLAPEKGKNSIGVDTVRQLSEKLYEYSQQGGAKIVWLPSAELLTDAASNALLKTLEEPPQNTYFLLQCQHPANLLATLRSRCFYYFLPAPENTMGLYWLQNQLPAIASLDAQTALKLSQGAPLAAERLLQADKWQQRNSLCQAIAQVLDKYDTLSLLPLLNCDDVQQSLHWLISLLSDAVKWRQQAQNYCVNQDQQVLIHRLAATQNMEKLLSTVDDWIRCRHQLLSVVGINRELLLTEQLLNWEKQLCSTQ
ncbi:DNA polymerase III subunit delta' [Xenorhabdus nematophila]|uniref:DNA polymerase III subunit delta' n=2 Tax=Xenorhabdus nematophila TaxID=628 RepID=D3VIE3_XENNA|nr:DNA polymerase III subunit delta' [Xenorhabdus nematophila]CEE90217.1 DNA polymerase III, delta prime subunit [Xenorhabdus nematophila str. Anatoliense]CEF32459.1 DNA polymerase III, delta prime subunit [Xenorhabdus nematophila str. Websteri]AYA39936.1 DNA polymerase III subunit delta' [Xenorhabdus nematophila]KHD27691.1 DNA polymerase III subunit delta' [Xenorhabdus nematophila]MBA0018569.1 DNA polymerase III subunit delta' [Xenorhabdus nematophila]